MSGRAGAPCRRVTALARAKLNLSLAVGPRRPDGFHEIATIFQSVSLADTLIATPRRRGFTLRVTHEDATAAGRARRDRVPQGPSNLVLEAARRVARHAGLEAGADFTLIKRIPSGAGLGGGSADAAATIVALERLHRFRLAHGDRVAIAASLGADVAFALAGGTALGTGKGEILRTLKLARPFRAIVIVPSWRIGTADAYARLARLKNRLTGWSAHLFSLQSLGREAIRAEDVVRLGNDFERVVGERRPQFESLSARMGAAGMSNARMTGSGSAMFCVLEPGAPARDVVGRFDGTEAVYVVRSSSRGWSLTSLP
jgi:4-diphosphocytidyl-2-C-methyl-D-erythritol kinase